MRYFKLCMMITSIQLYNYTFIPWLKSCFLDKFFPIKLELCCYKYRHDHKHNACKFSLCSRWITYTFSAYAVGHQFLGMKTFLFKLHELLVLPRGFSNHDTFSWSYEILKKNYTFLSSEHLLFWFLCVLVINSAVLKK